MRDLAGSRVLVVGMARSGVAAARLALARGATVTCTDLKAEASVVEGARCIYGVHRREDFLGADLIVVSPGVPARQPDLLAAAAAGVPVMGELGFAASLMPSKLPIGAVTGTNGKSSTTWFLGQLLRRAGRNPFVGGNLGTPLSAAVGGDWDAAAVEVSSYQLELAGGFHPRAGAVLNLTPDHMGRHGDMSNYAATKGRLFAEMGPEDFAILPAGDPWLTPLAATTRASVLWLGGSPGITLDASGATLRGTPDDGALSLVALKLPGAHNRWNTAAAALLGICLGLRRDDLDLGALTALPHRLELVAERDGVRWVNDSKATNVDAAMVGIEGLAGRQIVLLGGQGKEGADYAALRPTLERHAAHILCFGASGPEIAAALPGLPLEIVPTMAEAAARAAHLARAGESILLSPACASFDEFRDFEHRGEVFARLAREVNL